MEELVAKALELAREGLPSRRKLMEKLKVSEALAREIRAIVKYLMMKNGSEPISFDLNPVDIIDIPEPLDKNDRGPYRLKGYRRIGVISDVHFPYHDKTALKTALKKLYELEIDTLVMNGDIVDFYSVSFWERRPDRRNLQKERELALMAFDRIRKIFPDAEIIYKEGNHEERLARFLSRKAPELYDIEELQTDTFLRLKDFGIVYVKEKRRIEAGELDIIHGHEYRSFASVNIAISYLRKSFRNILIGHFHRRQEDTKKDIRDELSGAWVVGCLCDLKPDYSPNNEWTHGFAFVELFENKHFQVRNFLIQGEEVF
ncbi:metallophosphoesterase [Hydrogenobacter thermophilus TK-6]|uniref:Calcineurin-like phosphoesterase domain-containing protein n=1 Tax=Hydrogenobacter thermophilus (strain DSM 6534 / IAM 12695 / TK-6) TaxID=608538 RepID=D3DGP5_HYDTT|nr:metallophosphoesterase [Hydrogenobacter thermophilus]ADO44932.1 metallophosphoesterase [Hydrogenobacter thermophilus TK-6]BAI68997.1 hypothetical protein HTH_0534 [Hydrogenobacter thermophilus TK-6]